MKDAQKPDHISLNALIARLKEGRFAIPNFQRDFEWMPWDIQELMRSIFLDYYIGSLLLWKGKKENFEALACEDIFGLQESGSWEYIVLDGQQRLTAMHYACMAPEKALPNRNNRFFYYINVDRFMREEYDAAFGYDWLKRRWNKLLRDTDEQFKNHLFPLSVIGKGGWELYGWVEGYCRYWEKEAEALSLTDEEEGVAQARAHALAGKKFGDHVKEVIEQYQISFVELDRDLALDKVCDIFTQINSRGVRLDVFDLINALLTPRGIGLKELWREAGTRLSFIESERLNVYLLQVMSIRLQAYCSPQYLYYLMPGQEKTIRDPDGRKHKQVLISSTEEFRKHWDTAVAAVEDAINVLKHPQEYGAIASSFVPYVSILPCFAALRSHVNTLPQNLRLSAHRKIRHWYWASVFLNRYSGSVESTAARDFLDVTFWMENDHAEPNLIRDFADRYKQIDFKKETKRGSSTYNGVFNLLVLQGAKDWNTGAAPQHHSLDDHHIVPASWGKAKNLGDSINSILNRTPLSPDTNRNIIRDRLPNQYIPDMIKVNGEQVVRGIFESHLISPAALEILLRDPFTPADYEEFMAERQRSVTRAMEERLIEERLELPPDLRELDERIEKVELRLRGLIAEALDHDPQRVPSHVMVKIQERIARALKKNAALDASHYATLMGVVEYADLRELQDIIVNAVIWPLFSERFTSKEALALRFNQVADLRNAIRHSRSVDSVTRLDGEAGLHWFGALLAGSVTETEAESSTQEVVTSGP